MKSPISDRLAEVAAVTSARPEHEPRFFRLDRAEDCAGAGALYEAGAVAFVHDTLAAQLSELMQTRAPAEKLSEEELLHRVEAHLDGTPPGEYGVWVYYPWSRRMAHLLPEREFRELRTSRNRNKITFEEQEVLRRLRVGIVGLSIGHAAATTLTMEEIGGELHLADFDHLELSNMNRIRTGVHHLGLNKAIMAARDVYEMNPFTRVQLYPQGLNSKNLDDFLRPSGRNLDLVYEECDDLQMKVLVRERARALRIPVLMETSDRGLIDIERFDREPERPLFHGLVGEVKASELAGLSTSEKVPIVLKIIDQRAMSARMAASMVDIETTLKSWPQLASEVALGSAINTDVARRIALGQLNQSGRYYVDLEEIIKDGAALPLEESLSYEISISPLARSIELPALTPAAGALTQEHIRTLVAYGSAGFSGGNCQPWRFEYDPPSLRCILCRERSKSFLDCDDRASHLAFGSVAENISLAAQAMGIEAIVRPFPVRDDPTLVCTIDLALKAGGSAAVDPLVHQIARRATNRRVGERTEVARFELEALSRIATAGGGRLQWAAGEQEIERAADLLGRADLLRMRSKVMHSEMIDEIRWSPEEVERTRNGIDVATLEMSKTDLAGLKLISSWRVMSVTAAIGGGWGLQRPMRRTIRAASAVGLLTHPGTGPESFFVGGRNLQRVWLAATAQGFAFQPVTPITYLFYRLEHAEGEGLTRRESNELRALREKMRGLFEIEDGHAEAMLFRLARVGPPTARALRRLVDELIVFC